MDTSIKQYATYGNLVGNPVFIREEIHAKQLFVLTGFMKLGPGVTIKPGNEQCRVVNSLKHGGLR